MQAPTKRLADRYRFKQSLDLGAKSVAWVAVDEQSQREVVASALPTARVAALMGVVGLRHPHLASILDVVSDPEPDVIPGGTRVRAAAVVVADLVRGKSLHQVLKSGAPIPTKAVTWWIGLCDAVRSIHQVGGAHGAISPRSILVEPAGGREPAVLTQLLAPTSGAYCAPERLQGRGPSTADDVWALHASLFAALTGSPPFKGDSKDQLVLSMASGRMQQLSDFGLYEPELQQLFERGLLADLKRRRSDVTELLSELERWYSRSIPEPVSGHVPDAEEWNEDSATVVQKDALRMAALEMGEKRPAVAPVHSLPPVPVEDEADGGEDEATSILRQPTAQEIQALMAASGAKTPPTFDDQTLVDDRPQLASEPPTAIMNRDDLMIPGAPRVAGVEAPTPPVGHAPAAPAPAPAEPVPDRPLSAFPPPISSPPSAGTDLAQLALATDDVAVRKAGRGPLIVILSILVLVAAGIGVAMFLNYRSASTGRAAAAEPPPPATASTAGAAPPRSDPAAPAAPPAGQTASASDSADAPPSSAPTSLSEAVAAAPGGRAACVAGHFPADSFKQGEKFEFLCKPDDLRGVNSQLHRRLVMGGIGKVTPGMREWSSFGWYELAVTAVVRASCCRGRDGTLVDLPKTAGKCPQLADALGELAELPVAADRIPNRADVFEKAVTCLYAQAIPRPYHYKKRPTGAERRAFETFYRRALGQRED